MFKPNRVIKIFFVLIFNSKMYSIFVKVNNPSVLSSSDVRIIGRSALNEPSIVNNSSLERDATLTIIHNEKPNSADRKISEHLIYNNERPKVKDSSQNKNHLKTNENIRQKNLNFSENLQSKMPCKTDFHTLNCCKGKFSKKCPSLEYFEWFYGFPTWFYCLLLLVTFSFIALFGILLTSYLNRKTQSKITDIISIYKKTM